MKKIKNYLGVCVIFIVLYSLMLYIGYVRNSQERNPIPEWIVGKWQGVKVYSDETGSHKENIQLEFLHSGVLIYQSSLSRELEAGVVFRYDFISTSQLALNGRLQDEWNLIQNGRYLVIKGGLLRNQEVKFERVLGFERIIVLTAALLIVGLVMYKPYRPGDASTKTNDINNFERLPRILLSLGMHLLIFIIGFRIGQVAVTETSTSSLLLSQGLPWYPIILIEFFLLVFLLGFQNAKANRRANHYLGVFLMSSSLYGIFIGMLRLTVLYLFPLTLK